MGFAGKGGRAGRPPDPAGEDRESRSFGLRISGFRVLGCRTMCHVRKKGMKTQSEKDGAAIWDALDDLDVGFCVLAVVLTLQLPGTGIPVACKAFGLASL